MQNQGRTEYALEEKILLEIFHKENSVALQDFLLKRRLEGELIPMGLCKFQGLTYQNDLWIIACLMDGWTEGASIMFEEMIRFTPEHVRDFKYKEATLLHWIWGCPSYNNLDWDLHNNMAQQVIAVAVDLEVMNSFVEGDELLAGDWTIRMGNVRGFELWCSALTDDQFQSYYQNFNRRILDETGGETQKTMLEILSAREALVLNRTLILTTSIDRSSRRF